MHTPTPQDVQDCGPVTVRGCVDVHGQSYLGSLCSELPMLMSKGHAAARVILICLTGTAIRGHTDVKTHVSAKDHSWIHGPTPIVVYVDVHGPRNCWGPWKNCLWWP